MKKLFLLLLVLPLSVLAQTPSLTLSPVITGLSKPIFLTHCGDNRVFVVEQAGRIKVYDSAYNYLGIYLNLSNIVTQPSSGGDERGLLGLAFHPNYSDNGYLYVNYTRTVSGQLKTFIARYSVFSNNPNKADSLSAFEILSFNQPFSNHNGGCLKFGPDGYLYIGTGDGGSGNDPQGNGQKMNTFLGKMLRIDVDGGSPYIVPSDNPFVGVANTFPEIWAYGIRNPWRFSFDKLNGNLWIADVGQNMYEEVNVHYNGDASGENYGWRCFEGMHSTGLGSGVTGVSCPNYSDTHQPVYEYTHTGGECSVTGGYVYRGALHNIIFGNYLCADYCSGKIRRLIDNGNGTFNSEIIYTGNSTVSFGEDRWGELYVCSSTQNAVLKLSDNNCAPVAFILNGDTAAICAGQNVVLSALNNPLLTYEWFKTGDPNVQGTSNDFNAENIGEYYVVATNSNGCSTASSNIVVVDKPLPEVQLNSLPSLCPNDSSVELIGTPAGGIFSGNGVNGNFFNPALDPGQYDVTYTYTEPNGCSNFATINVSIQSLPVLSFINLPDTVCSDVMSEQITLLAEPTGGTFTGSNVAGNILTLNQFNTNYTVTYSYSEPDGCNNEITADVFFALCTGLYSKKYTDFIIYPNPTNGLLYINSAHQLYSVELFNLSGQTVLTKQYLGNAVLDLTKYYNGLFFYRITSETGVKTGKIELLKYH